MHVASLRNPTELLQRFANLQNSTGFQNISTDFVTGFPLDSCSTRFPLVTWLAVGQ
ncbi:hypothetical protein B0H10DRAFT_2006941 [Mycena sp. CBHHK59/15]|nr:hypothetical protein B0H10DRAFT_2006941 [Mycena sp. CBHHK59/15]